MHFLRVPYYSSAACTAVPAPLVNAYLSFEQKVKTGARGGLTHTVPDRFFLVPSHPRTLCLSSLDSHHHHAPPQVRWVIEGEISAHSGRDHCMPAARCRKGGLLGRFGLFHRSPGSLTFAPSFCMLSADHFIAHFPIEPPEV